MSSTDAAEDAYFSSNPPPRTLPTHLQLAESFIASHAATPSRRVVLITSGGTTVPLEKQTVRFIDNFSAGTRGATSAEHFLAAGYAVVFLHRQFSLLPYARTLQTESLLDLLTDDEGGWRDVLTRYRAVKDANLLLVLPFVTIGDYLHLLRGVSRLMGVMGGRGLWYLAAAVSDFFVPPERMAEHKIQSTDAAGEHEAFDNFDGEVPLPKRLVIDLDPVPKFLKNLVDGWAPRGMIVSYKLETDPDILVKKARVSLRRYQHHLVIGNLLSTRKWEVVFVSPGREDLWLRVPMSSSAQGAAAPPPHGRPLTADDLPREDPDTEIEKLIIPAVVELHDAYLGGQ